MKQFHSLITDLEEEDELKHKDKVRDLRKKLASLRREVSKNEAAKRKGRRVSQHAQETDKSTNLAPCASNKINPDPKPPSEQSLLTNPRVQSTSSQTDSSISPICSAENKDYETYYRGEEK